MAGVVVWSEKYGGYGRIDTLLNGNRSAIYGALVSVLGALLGFAITTFSITLGFATSDRMALVRASEHHRTLWKVYKSAVRWLAIGTVAALVGLVVDRDSSTNHSVMYFVGVATVICFVRLVNTVSILEHITDLITGPSKARTADQP